METIYQTENIKPSYSWDVIEQHEIDAKIILRRKKALLKWFLRNFADNIPVKYSLDDLGTSCIRLFVYLNKNEDSTIKLIKWLTNQKNWKREKFWRKDKGYFSYKLHKEKEKYQYGLSYIIMFEEGANIDGCVIKKKRKMQEIFVTDCEKESIIF